MLLDRIDIDAHGPLHRVELGPMAEHLNVLFAPDGSGKTAIARFVRDALVDRDYPLGMFSSSTGRVVLADRHGMVHCHREKDGTSKGRRFVTFESRGDFQGRYDLLENSWLRGISERTDQGEAIASLELPEAIVDSVITDTSGGSVARVVSACVRSRLDSPGTYQSLPLQDDLVYADRSVRDDGYGQEMYEQHRRMRRELADIEAELARLSHDEANYEALMSRRNRLTARLNRPVRVRRTTTPSRRHDLELRSASLQQRARVLRSQQSDLRRRLADLDLDIASCDLSREQLVADSPYTRNEYHVLCRDRDDVQHQLDRATAALDTCLSEAGDVVRELRLLASNVVTNEVLNEDVEAFDHEALTSELRRIDDRLAVLSRVNWLRSQRGELLKQLQMMDWRSAANSPLAEAASRWLVRLSGGRLRRVDWPDIQFDGQWKSHHRDDQVATGVRINGRDEIHCEPTDRTLASIAVRMAAGDFLARTGRHVPLVLEIPQAVCRSIKRRSAHVDEAHAWRERGDHLRSNDPIAAALRDYAHSGRQVLLLTDNRELARQLGRVGARSFAIHAHRVVHAHRPLWRPQYQSETYEGPHPHTYAHLDAAELHAGDLHGGDLHGGNLDRHDHDESKPFFKGPAASKVAVDPIDINRDLDLAWRESQRAASVFTKGSLPVSDHSRRTDWARDGVLHRDGYYFIDRFTTDHHKEDVHSSNASETSATTHEPRRAKPTPASPFYLSVDSPIDQAPSIDAVAAARLRGLKVTHITHLMQSDPNRLSDALGLASVDAATVRRWQAECRLACRVPNVRGFDARLLVGCGVTTPGQLAAIHPTDLLHEVQAFLATDRGQHVLLSGTSQELSRLMTWIATANSTRQGNSVNDHDSHTQARRRRQIIHAMNERESMLHHHNHQTHREVERETVGSGSWTPESNATQADSQTERFRRKQLRSTGRNQARRKPTSSSNESVQPKLRNELRFYLHRESPIVDAPSIGPKMAKRLNHVDIHTVDDLLTADPETVASEIDHHRVDADTVLQWQQQATLVCRVPMLRGHDAQLLVAAEVTTPEELAESDADDLFPIIDTIARSSQGQRILRGGTPPDLKEVQDWISWAENQRSLRAA